MNINLNTIDNNLLNKYNISIDQLDNDYYYGHYLNIDGCLDSVNNIDDYIHEIAIVCVMLKNKYNYEFSNRYGYDMQKSSLTYRNIYTMIESNNSSNITDDIYKVIQFQQNRGHL